MDIDPAVHGALLATIPGLERAALRRPGYAIEYGSTPYLLFYLAEFSNITLMSGLMAVLFLGGAASALAFFPRDTAVTGDPAWPGPVWLWR